MSTDKDNNPAPTVRFSSANQEIEPDASVQHVESLTMPDHVPKEQLSPEAQEEIRNLSKTLQQSRLQSRRMENFSYEPVSLPVSRVPSSSGTQTPSLAHSSGPSPKPSPPATAVHSPPLTPAGSGSREAPRGSTSSTAEAPQPPKTAYDVPGVTPSQPKHTPQFTIGPTGDSIPPSREPSPSGTSSPYSRPFTPSGDKEDPYARSKRPPQTRNLDSIDPRFIFNKSENRKSHSNRASMSSFPVPRSQGGSSTDLKSEGKRHSILSSERNLSVPGEPGMGKPHGSMSELKRFFKLGGHKHKDKRSASPSKAAKNAKSGTRTPPSGQSATAVPFADDHGLTSKYGKFGKVLGSGAGGSVRLMKRSSDGTTFAVKQFRARHSYETERDYNKKVTAEFCVGSTLHHGNIIETMDLVQEKGNWFVVMEYAPFDLFAIVMSGKMGREEVSCCTFQILSGLTYLHSMGLAHRDMKLDNVVVNEHGIMKIIDFGSAVVFRYPFENDVVLATGIVGSDPYLAPEVYDVQRYDPQPADIWSLAIIFCCMTLRRFPWKAPRITDNSYKLFVAPANDGPRPIKSRGDANEDRRKSAYQSEPTSRQVSEISPTDQGNQRKHHHHSSSHHYKSEPPSQEGDRKASTGGDTAGQQQQSDPATQQPQQQQTIKGPWRLLRLLPRESRHIIGRMLEIDPRKRATMEEILQDKWIRGSPVCRQEEGGKIVRAGSHEHTLEPGTPQTPATSRKH